MDMSIVSLGALPTAEHNSKVNSALERVCDAMIEARKNGQDIVTIRLAPQEYSMRETMTAMGMEV